MSQIYSFFDILLEPVFVVDHQGKTLYANEAAATISGVSTRKISRGQNFLDLFSFSENLSYFSNIVEVTDPQPYRELEFTTPLGHSGKTQITIQPSPLSNEEQHWIIFFRDVTLEERLQKKYRAELEQKEDFIKALEVANRQLEDYSKNLEFKVQERTLELSKLNTTLSALLDSLGQGFFLFDSEGKVQDIVSKACLNILETNPAGKNIWDVFKLPENRIQGFKNWSQTIFEEMLPFDDLSCLGPQTFAHSQGRSISLNYYPLRDISEKISAIVVVATDITELIEAQQSAEREKEYAKMIIQLIKSKQQILVFSAEAKEMLSRLEVETQKHQGNYDFESVFRDLHTLKGGAGLFSIQDLAHTAHESENLLAELQNSWSEAIQEKLYHKVLELKKNFAEYQKQTEEVLGKKQLHNERLIEMPYSALLNLSEKMAEPKILPAAKAQLVLDWALQPASQLLSFYNEVLEIIAARLQKSVHPLVFKNDVSVLPESYQQLFGTFVHLFRNAVDHGIESSEMRLENGKPEFGTITVDFQIQGRSSQPRLLIHIQDDGGGIATEKVRTKLLAQGQAAETWTDYEVHQAIFSPSFSTSEQVTDISGRGVGLDAVKACAEKMGGRVWVESEKNKGTSFYIEVPYVTSILETAKPKVA